MTEIEFIVEMLMNHENFKLSEEAKLRLLSRIAQVERERVAPPAWNPIYVPYMQTLPWQQSQPFIVTSGTTVEVCQHEYPIPENGMTTTGLPCCKKCGQCAIPNTFTVQNNAIQGNLALLK